MDLGTWENLKDRLNLAEMGKPALVGVVAVIVVVAVIAAGRLIGTATASEFSVSDNVSESSAEHAGQDDVQSTFFVHVSGAVHNPGLCEVPADARVADAIDAAGGFTDAAIADSVNLARPVADGEQIRVASGDGADDPATQTASEQPAEQGAGGAGLVNVNSASSTELTALPGIGQATAEKIVADRQANGPFKTVDDLKRVSGIGDKKFEALRDLVCI